MLPNLLLIGAMKAGTTSLYEDLSKFDDVFMCPEKEPNDLLTDKVETAAGCAKYAAKFSRGRAMKWRGEASTAYSMIPTYKGVARRARHVLGSNIRIIYLTREPISRIISQYRHLWGLGLETRPMNSAVLATEYISYSRYEWQLAAWRAEFADNQILVLRFEDYVTKKEAVVQQISDFLELPTPETGVATHRNATRDKPIVPPGGSLSSLIHSQLYYSYVKPFVPYSIRSLAKAWLLPKAAQSTEQLSPSTLALLEEHLRE